jgi:hypothetical protein
VNGTPVVGSNPTLGTVPCQMTQLVGNQVTWNSALWTSVGWYAYSQTTRYYQGEIGEVLVYNREVTNDERLLIEAYLTSKWISGAGVPEYSLSGEIAIEVSNGGVVNLAGTSQTISTVIIGGGGGSFINGTITITDALIVTVKSDGTTDPLAFDNVVFGPDAQLIIIGMEYARGVIDLFTANILSPNPPFDREVLPKGWRVSYTNGGLCRLSYGGTIIMLR